MVIKLILTENSPADVVRILCSTISRFSVFPVTVFRQITVLPGRSGNWRRHDVRRRSERHELPSVTDPKHGTKSLPSPGGGTKTRSVILPMWFCTGQSGSFALLKNQHHHHQRRRRCIHCHRRHHYHHHSLVRHSAQYFRSVVMWLPILRLSRNTNFRRAIGNERV